MFSRRLSFKNDDRFLNVLIKCIWFCHCPLVLIYKARVLILAILMRSVVHGFVFDIIHRKGHISILAGTFS